MTKYKYFGDMCKRADEHNVLYRNSRSRWLEAWSVEELDWAIDNGFLVSSSPMLEYGECSTTEYYELTKLGKRLAHWYVYPTWFYIKYVIFRWHFWKYKVFRLG